MRQAIYGNEEELGFKPDQRSSKRQHSKVNTNIDFADHIALITEEMNQAQELITRVNIESGKIGLNCNVKKTEITHYNQVNHSSSSQGRLNNPNI